MSAPLNIAFLTPGTGGWYCGACMRDNALARALHAAGHKVALLPMYLPLQLDEEMLESADAAPVFFGGINIYLQQKSALFRHMPRWLDQLLNHPRLLRRVARHSHMTSAREHGAMTLAMLRPENHRFGKEMAKLLAWLAQDPPDILCLSTALQAGMIRELKQHLDAKVICCFQGEDTFLDGLPQPFRDACWQELAIRVREADLLVSPSRFYADLMERRLGPQDITIEVMPNGINLDGYQPLAAKPGPPVIGFLARLCREKGLEIMVDAFIHLRSVLDQPDARLHLAGAATADNEPLIESLQARLTAAGLAGQVTWQRNISREDKAAMLRALTLFSVPATYPEAFGLYVIEAMASGVPVVQPATASFPEIVGNAGVLVGGDAPASTSADVPPAVNPQALAAAWHDLLRQPDKLRDLASQGRRAAEEFYAVAVMRDRFVALAQKMLDPAADNRRSAG
jgi:glycosyltransferase involved in cell wall biosynthesis